MSGGTIRVGPAEWSQDAATTLAPTLGGDSPEVFAAMVADGRAALFAVEFLPEEGAPVRIGFYLARVKGDEGQIVLGAVENQPAGLDLTAVLLPEAEARFSGVKRLSIITMRPGLAKKLGGMGYTARTIEMVKEIKQ